MRHLAIVPLAIALLMPAGALGQDSVKPAPSTLAGFHSQRALTKPKTLSGTVGEDGRTITTAKNTRWTIANPDVLKEHTGKQVKVKCQIASNAEANVIQVLWVKVIPSEVKFTANPSDAAFRR